MVDGERPVRPEFALGDRFSVDGHLHEHWFEDAHAFHRDGVLRPAPRLTVDGPAIVTARSVRGDWGVTLWTVALSPAASSAAVARLRPSVTRPSETTTTVPCSWRFAATPSPSREFDPLPIVARVTGTPSSSISRTSASVVFG